VTQAGLEYIRRYRDLKYNETVFELLAKELEIAKLDEAREGAIVQVVDAAVVPDKRSFPQRTLIVIVGTAVAMIVAPFWVLFRSRLAQTLNLPDNRERIEAIRQALKRNTRSSGATAP
jgi:uncharacterized protein involved in exopolysaccharide biosynthesis